MNFKALLSASVAAVAIAGPALAEPGDKYFVTDTAEFFQQHNAIIDDMLATEGPNQEYTKDSCYHIGRAHRNVIHNDWIVTQENISDKNKNEWRRISRLVSSEVKQCKRAGFSTYERSTLSAEETQRQVNEIVGAFGQFTNSIPGGVPGANVVLTDADRRAYCERDGGSYVGKTYSGEARCRTRGGAVMVAFDSEVKKWVAAGRPTYAF